MHILIGIDIGLSISLLGRTFKPVSLRIGQSPGNSDEKKIPPEAVIWVTLMSAPPPPEGAVLCGSLWPGKGGIFESIMRSPVRQTHCVEAP